MNELFNIGESKSPRIKWMERHHLTVRDNPANVTDRRFEAMHGMTVIAYGANEDEALVNAAKSLNIRLWNEI
jgi:hypothetical protein